MSKANMDQAEQLLENSLEIARQDQGRVPDGLLARVMADAASEQALRRRLAQERPLPRSAPTPFSGAGVWQVFGGWPVLGGLGTVAVCGFLIGLSPPALLDGLNEVYFGESDLVMDISDLAPDVGSLLVEG